MNEKKSCTDCWMTRLPMSFNKNVRCSRTKFLAPSPTYKCPERRGRLKIKLIGRCSKSTHTSYLSRTPRIYSCKFFLAGVNFYRFNAKNWQFTVYFAVITQKNWQFSVYFVVIYALFRCKFYSPKILIVWKKWQIWGMVFIVIPIQYKKQIVARSYKRRSTLLSTPSFTQLAVLFWAEPN